MGFKDAIIKNITMKTAGKVAEGVIFATGEAVHTASKDRVPRSSQVKLIVPKSSSEYYGANYLSVKEELEAYGFEQIGLIAKKDLINGWLTKDGSIDSITINGKDNFRAKAKFPAESRVVIVYHTFKTPK